MLNSMQTSFILFKSNNSKNTESTARPNRSSKVCTCVTPFEPDIEAPAQLGCSNCESNLEKVTALKKTNIVIEYENARLKQEIEELKKQNMNLKVKLAQNIQQKLKQLGEGNFYTSIKQDLEAELFECRYMSQLLMLGQYPKQNHELKDKLEQAVMEKLVLQEQLEQKTRIINDTVLHPIYHYDSRIKNLREIVRYFYRIAATQCKKSHEMIKAIKKDMQALRSNMKMQIDNLLTHYGGENKQNINSLSFQANIMKTYEFSTNYKSAKPKQQKNQPNKQEIRTYLKPSKTKKSKSRKKDKMMNESKCHGKIKQQKNVRWCCIKQSI